MPLEETGWSRNERKAGEGSVCGSHQCGSRACQAGGRENELETLRNVSRPGTQRVESSHGPGGGGEVGGIMPTSWAHVACSSKDGELKRSVSLLDEWDLGSLEFTSLWNGSLVIR